MKNLNINSSFQLTKIPLPGTSLNILVVDDFIKDINIIENFAKNTAYFNPMFTDNTLFPGMRDKMPKPYTRLLHTFFEEHLLSELTTRVSSSSIFHSSLLSLVTCTPSLLSVNQKMPHVDSCNESDFAFVHYLSPKELGGTSFYCFKPKSMIEFKPKDKLVLNDMITQVTNSPEDHASYITSSTSLFEQILTIDAKINRLIIYPANILHSANLITKESYSGDIEKGRLSISSFASIKTN
jgi:hypothetical protein